MRPIAFLLTAIMLVGCESQAAKNAEMDRKIRLLEAECSADEVRQSVYGGGRPVSCIAAEQLKVERLKQK